jgi:hypothetical protein
LRLGPRRVRRVSSLLVVIVILGGNDWHRLIGCGGLNLPVLLSTRSLLPCAVGICVFVVFGLGLIVLLIFGLRRFFFFFLVVLVILVFFLRDAGLFLGGCSSCIS